MTTVINADLMAAARGPLPLSGPWRLLVTPPMTGAANMAMDHALMDRARRTGQRTLRVYAWSRPTLSFGRNQAVRGRVDPAVAATLGVDLVRRPTGGRALLHHREVTYSITAPLAAGDSVRSWYASITDLLISALRSMGVPADAARAEGRTPIPGTASCFVQADAGEVAVGGRKLVGSALVRLDDALLQHGSILIEDDQVMLSRLLPPDEAPAQPAGTLRDALGRTPPFEEVASALSAALRAAGPAEVRPISVDSPLASDVERIQATYASDEWTFRY